MYAVDGTPTDCVNIAVTQIFKRPPDLVVSGINKGWNLGDDVTYSGTVAGALEGALLGVPALAVSLRATRATYDFSHAAAGRRGGAAGDAAAAAAAADVSEHERAAGASRRGIASTVQAKRNHITSVAERHDPKGRPYYWIEEGQDDWEPHDRSDYQAVRDGYVSVTPLHPDLTAHQALAAVERYLSRRKLR